MDTSAGDSSAYRIEIDLLMQLTEPYKAILDATETDVNIIHQKNDAWTEISKQYNLNRRFKKKTCRELRKIYQRMVIKNRSKSADMQLEDDKKPKLKKVKMSLDSNEEALQSNNGAVLNKDSSSVSSVDGKLVGHFSQSSISSSKKKKKEKIVLPKNCMVIMRPITKAQLRAISKSPVKLLTSISQRSPPRTKEASVPPSVSSFLKLSPKLGTPVSSAGQNVGVVIKVENGNITSATPQPNISNVISHGERVLGSVSQPRRASSPSRPNSTSPSTERYMSRTIAVAGSNFSSTPGCATLTTSMAQSSTATGITTSMAQPSTATGISVSSSESVLQPQSPEEVNKQSVINTYSKIHPQVVRQTVSVSPSRTQIVKRIVWSSPAPPARYARHTSSRASVTEPTSLVSTSLKGASSKPADEISTSASLKVTSSVPATVLPITTPPKVASCKPTNVVHTSTPPKVARCISNIVPTSIVPIVASCSSANVVLTSTSPKVASCTSANVVSKATPPTVVICKPTDAVPTCTSPRVVIRKPDNKTNLSSPLKVASCQSANFAISNTTNTTRCQTVSDPNTASVQNFTRCQLVPTSQAMTFLSRTATQSHISTTLPQPASVVAARVESPPAAVTTTVTTSAATSVGITSQVLSPTHVLEEGQDEGISVAMAEPEILNIRVLEANLDVRAAQARVDAEEALREEALAKLAMARSEMDHQTLRHKIELRHMRRLNALALRHAKELHVAALQLRRKE